MLSFDHSSLNIEKNESMPKGSLYVGDHVAAELHLIFHCSVHSSSRVALLKIVCHVSAK